MSLNRCNFCMALVMLSLAGGNGAAMAAASNPRSTGTSASSSVVSHSDGRDARRATSAAGTARASGGVSSQNVSRAAASLSGTLVSRDVNARAATASATAPRTTARSATNTAARTAVGGTTGRSGRTAPKTATISRAGTARATAIFSDVSKIGTGYATCRDAYATCMDQFCAMANDTYRRCFCSSRFIDFRDTENAMDQAKLLLMQFQDNNLEAVDKTAAEVSAMYSATEGEKAIKKDTSGAAKMLNQINDLLSGKSSTSSYSRSSGTSLGVLSFDFSSDMDDIWSGGGSDLFGGGNQNLSALEGEELFNAATKQCMAVVADSCESSAVMNMSRSSYGILISQDCNAYEKSVNSKRESILQTVRTAEKYLREARLEEYRAHNSADVNECVSKVRDAITSDTACGANYRRCLDYTGAYINQSTGEPIYTARLFELTNLITLDGASGSTDVVAQNPNFNKFLESRKMFATTALDTCRDKSNLVWDEFKRTALIEIAQAQDEKLEEVKMSCVSTMAECYDTQTNALKSFDNTTAAATGAISAYAARAMCQDKVIACAALYGNGDQQCSFDGNGKLTGNIDGCGLSALLKFVNTVDTIRINEGCSSALEKYAKDLCTPSSDTKQQYPWNCRGYTKSTLEDSLRNYAEAVCIDANDDAQIGGTISTKTTETINNIVDDVMMALDDMLGDACYAAGGYWQIRADGDTSVPDGYNKLSAFYNTMYPARNQPADRDALGWCIENSSMVSCLAYNGDEMTEMLTRYDRTREECIVSEDWYQMQCSVLGDGYYENGICYVFKD